MSFKIDVKDYIAYLIETKSIIESQKDYITKLDATTGDGDHWANIYMGFEKITSMADTLATLSLSALCKQIGTIMFSSIGGSSGALYGSGYLAAAKVVNDKEYLDIHSLYEMLHAMLQAIMERGKTKPEQKTMVDSLYTALQGYQKGLEDNQDEEITMDLFIKGAKEGAEKTKYMKAIKGRASYRTDKGVGHLDPGAVTMSIQLEQLGKYVIQKIGGNT